MRRNHSGIRFCKRFLLAAIGATAGSAALASDPLPGGELQIVGAPEGAPAACPLKHTDVEADIVGFVGRVTVRQTFYNPLDIKIEAIYVFPLPQDAAVDDMVMTVGERRIVGQIRERSEAREIYEQAKAAGHVASLLDQERPNIFTQSVANIEPGVTVEIEISYVETLKYEDGVFEWVFPMVVGPRYIPGAPTSKIPGTPAPLSGDVVELDRSQTAQGAGEPKGHGWAPDTDRVPDASRITPPVVKPGLRAGHDIGLAVHLDAGLEIFDVESKLHAIDTQRISASEMSLQLREQSEIPNRDFILRYRLATDEIGDALLTHADERGRFFTLILQPPRRVEPSRLVPRELVFVLDTSGSMGGFPIEKAKEVMSKLIDTMQPRDTFNLITFAGDTRILWEQPRHNTPENRAEAQRFLASRRGGGGTEMMKAIEAALAVERDAGPDDTRPGRPAARSRPDAELADAPPIRIVCFMTDGYVGNDFEIIDAVQKHADTTRVFSFGIGNSVNRFLLDGMAHAGRGEVEYVTLAAEGAAAVERFHERLLATVLTDVEIDWGGLPVSEVYPRRVPDLFSSKPILVHGRLDGPCAGTITLRGNTGAGRFEQNIDVNAPAAPAAGSADENPDAGGSEALASLWARAKVTDLMNRDLAALQRGEFPEELKSEITSLGIAFRLMTQFTSFVAVEELTVTIGGEPTTITVPVEMPDGVSYEGVFGDQTAGLALSRLATLGAPLSAPSPGVGGRLAGSVGSEGGRGRETVAKRALAPGSAADKKAQVGGGAAGQNAAPTRPAELESADADRRDAEFDPLLKLAAPLRELADKVAKEGEGGALTVDGIRVVGYRVDVMIYLSDASESTRQALAKLGFTQSAESKAIRMWVGSIDVRKLAELAKLDAVLRVEPVRK